MSLEKGDNSPEFELQDQDLNTFSLKFPRDENILLLFFPLAFSNVCTDEMCTVRDNLKLYSAFSVEVIGISVDSPFTLKEFKKRNNINFKLLSDFNKEVSESFGALYQDYFGMRGVSKRAAFLISKDGIVKHAEVLEDSSKLPDFKSLREALKG